MVALIVETGLGVPDANSYGELVDIEAYFDNRGYDWTTGTEDDQIRAAIRGTQALEAIYGGRLAGSKVGGRSQSLLFPRKGMKDNECIDIAEDEIPIEWKKGSYELIWQEFQEPDSTTPSYIQSERTVSETLGPLSVTYAQSNGGGSYLDAQPVYPLVDKILEPLLGLPVSLLFGTTDRI